jgi:glycosyltransferase involved in cell wall biosynthesis
MSAAAKTLLGRSAVDLDQPLHVLTITPFFPSVRDPAQGCFIAEPLSVTERYGIRSSVIAVQPFYRERQHACEQSSCEWKHYYNVPGNLGLVTSGAAAAISLNARLRKLHQATPVDVIHAHGALPCGEAARLLGARLKIPFCVTIHGLDTFADRQAGEFLGKWARKACWRVYQCATRIICISEEVRRQLPNHLQSPIDVLYNAVDVERFAPAAQAFPSSRILSVGNLIAIKDHALLLRAFARVLGNCPDAELEIIGEGAQRSNLVSLAERLGVRPRVVFRPRQSREEIASAMQRSAVFALPSRYEGLGCVYLEAMACGKPVIGCFGQGIAEVVNHGKNGFLISPGDEVALSQLLLLLLRDEALRRRVGVAARETILRGYTLDHQARQLALAYRECVG